MVSVNCKYCDKKFIVKLYKSKKTGGVFCSRKCHNLFRRKYVSFNSDGYILIGCSDHPESNVFGVRYLHRFIAEIKLGRPLKKGEIVHHIDHNPSNNSIDNIRIFNSRKEHRLFHFAEKALKNGYIFRVTKPCLMCKKIKPVEEFALSGGIQFKNKRAPRCKLCTKIFNKKNERILDEKP